MIKAKYTVVLKALLDNPEAKGKIDLALSKYPLYTPPKAYDMVPTRPEINKRLLNHYKYREIGFETFGRFLDELEITMDEIMPYYNELLKTVVTMADLPNPFDNVDVVETFEQERTGTATTEATASRTQEETTTHSEESEAENNGTKTENQATTANQTTHDKHIESDTPQESLQITAEQMDYVKYASNVNWSKNNQEGTSEANSTETTKDTATASKTSQAETNATQGETSSTTNESTDSTRHTYTKKGNQGVNTYAHDMNEFRTSIIDVIDQMINDTRIQELFMLIY